MSSLDDFFAKKDRRRSATKTNLLAADELYRTLEEVAKVPQEVESSEKLPPEAANGNAQQSLEFGIRFSDESIDEEDEWCDFTEEHDQPFPNLKRNSKLVLSSAAVTATDEVKLATENGQSQDSGGDGLGVGQATDDPGKSSCPWLKLEPNNELNSSLDDPADETVDRKSQSQSQSQSQPQPQPQSQSQSRMCAKKPVYVPPALRQSQSEFSVCPRKQTPLVPVKLAKGQAPDLNNVDFFPSLCQSRISKRAK